MKAYTETQRLDWVLLRTPRMDFDWKLKEAGKDGSHWLVVWIGSESREAVYSGSDYRECIDKAMTAEEARVAAELEEEQLEEDV